MNPGSDSARLFACFALSCLLHAGVIFTPYLGASSSAYQPAVQGGQKPPRTLDVTLVSEQPSAFAVAEVFDKGGSTADAPAERMPDETPRPALDRTVGIGLLPIPAPAYYSTDQLTKRPQPTGAADLDAPEIRPIIASGTIILKLWINELGNVNAVDVENTDLPEMFTETAVAAFRNLHFVPGELNGQPVGTMMRIEVTYDDGRKPPP
jgi:hypothetical protein